jgi:uncharacterized membrane protein YfcA
MAAPLFGEPETTAAFLIIVGIASTVAGVVGSLTGLGGGVVIVPLLTIGFGVNIRYAMGASLISVIATSSGAAAAYVREGFTNIRIGMFLEVATTAGALVGALLTGLVSPDLVGSIFGVTLIYSAYLSSGAHQDHVEVAPPDSLARRLRLTGSNPTGDGSRFYAARHIPLGFLLMFGAGILSGLLGIGSGAVKVLAMDRAMRLPFKVSTTTSNFMIGVTAAASAGVYLRRGYIHPVLAMPVMLGVLVGATVGSRILVGAPVLTLRRIFAAVVVVLGVEMLYKGFTRAF